ncbi:antitoxin ParD1/3/4 [Rhizobium aquaticum]|uniref:Antitoxin ParD1/3/4 n=1 Tax=Rhizobium aquaticum TaxID=1549636 RepID=A0ABV2IXE4_9HYPH
MPTMNVSLTPEFVRFIEGEVESGAYASASEVVRDALRLLQTGREERAARLERLRQEIARGEDDFAHGRVSVGSAQEILSQLLDRT